MLQKWLKVTPMPILNKSYSIFEIGSKITFTFMSGRIINIRIMLFSIMLVLTFLFIDLIAANPQIRCLGITFKLTSFDYLCCFVWVGRWFDNFALKGIVFLFVVDVLAHWFYIFAWLIIILICAVTRIIHVAVSILFYLRFYWTSTVQYSNRSDY